MFEAFFTGLSLVFQWPSIGFLMLGVLIGIVLGVIPGLGSIVGLVLLLPFTYTMEPVPAFALMLGMFAVTTTSDTIAAVMLGIPGSSASQAIVIDGYPLAMKGHAARAFGASFTVSMIGGVFGAFVMAVSLPIIRPLIQSFTSPEMFMLGVLGLSLVGSLSGSSLLKGLAVAVFGLLISTVGYAPTVSQPRYFFDQTYLLDGLPLVPIVLGLFGLPELLEMAIRNTSISRIPKEQAEGGGILDGVRDALRNWWLAIRCSAIGTYVGIMPGVGGAVVDWVAYAHTVQSAKDKSQFGKGDIRGVIGPDAANNANLGGSLIPTIAFGIPGGLGSAILLGALVMQGLKPGVEMLTTKLDITFSMVWSIIVANMTAAILLMFCAKQVAKIAFVPGHIIVPVVVLFILMGGWLASASMGDWLTIVAFGIIGIAMKRGGWPRPSLVLAIVLGALMESSLLLSMRVYDGFGWLSRPMVIILILLVVAVVASSAWGIVKTRRKGDEVKAGEGHEGSPIVSLPFALFLLALFIVAGIIAWPWEPAVGAFPVSLGVVGFLLLAMRMLHEVREFRVAAAAAGGVAAAGRNISREYLLGQTAAFFGYLLATVVLSVLIGQKLAIPIFVAVYLLRWGRYNWRVALGAAVACWAVLVFFYDRVMHIFWYLPVLDAPIRQLLPQNFPMWLIS